MRRTRAARRLAASVAGSLLLAACASLPELAAEGERRRLQTRIDRGADLEARGEQGCTALFFAAARGDATMVESLLAGGADPNARCQSTRLAGTTALHGAASGTGRPGHDDECIRRLVEAGAEVDARGPADVTPLSIASRQGNLVAARALLDAGAEVDHRDARGESALAWAAARGDMQLVQLLLQRGATCDIEACAPPSELDPEMVKGWMGAYSGVIRVSMVVPLVEALRRHDPALPIDPQGVEIVPTLAASPNAWVEPETFDRVFIDATYLYLHRGVIQMVTARETRQGWPHELVEQQYHRYRGEVTRDYAGMKSASWLTAADETQLASAGLLPAPEAMSDESPWVMRVLVAFVLLHEVAHLRACHNQGRRPPVDERLRREREADAWALTMMIRMGYPMPVLERLFAVQARLQQIRTEVGYLSPAGHPSWQERRDDLRALMQTTEPQACDLVVLRSPAEPVELHLPRSIDEALSSQATVWLGREKLVGLARWEGKRVLVRARDGEQLYTFSVERPLTHRPTATWSQGTVGGTPRPLGELSLVHDSAPRGFMGNPSSATPGARLSRAMSGGDTRPVKAIVRETYGQIDGVTTRYLDGELTLDEHDQELRALHVQMQAQLERLLGAEVYPGFRKAWFDFQPVTCFSLDEPARSCTSDPSER